MSKASTTTNRPASPGRGRLFVTADGRSLAITFFLVASLFLLWGFCNGMIDTMDKHFQDQLHLTKAQSAWVQFAHYMGYSLMALPAGLLTRRLGYKAGIIFGLMLVALGGFWFIPATAISQFWAFLAGVCLIAMGLTVLETVANPYTTVLGPKEYGPARINLAQSFNGIGWIFGPIVGAAYFYSEGGVEKAHGQLYIPYLGVAIVVLCLAAAFIPAPVPDINVDDEYQTDDTSGRSPAVPVAKEKNRNLILLMMFLNVAVLGLSIFLIIHTILPSLIADHANGAEVEAGIQKIHWLALSVVGALVLLSLPVLLSISKKVTNHSIWAHPHFSGATLAQFLYVAAQAGIFSFFINSMTVDKSNGSAVVPPLPVSWSSSFIARWNWIETRTAISPDEINDFPGLASWLKSKPDAVAAFLNNQLSTGQWAGGQLHPSTRAMLADYKEGSAVPKNLQKALVQDLNRIIRQELTRKAGDNDASPSFYDEQRFGGVKLDASIRKLAASTDRNDHATLRLNRLLLQAACPAISYNDNTWAISDKGASNLSSLAFICFLLGRISGAWLLKRAAAHKTLGLYALLNILVCGVVIGKLGWLSVLCVFVSYFFMSIMFPTIFAVGIYGLGAQSKKKASAFIVMSITGGALMPKFMGYLGDIYNMSTAFWMPLACFCLIALYGFSWSKLSQSDEAVEMNPGAGH